MIAGMINGGEAESADISAWLYDSFCEAISADGVTAGVACLSAGAAQIFAEVLRTENIPYTVIIPSEDYEEHFDHRVDQLNYLTLLPHASEVIKLPYKEFTPGVGAKAEGMVIDMAEIVYMVAKGSARPLDPRQAKLYDLSVEKKKKMVRFNILNGVVTR
ncbi:MAG: hypothetical protein PHH49_03810 [Candidatus Omnitrophica bacterium]|nr:hypothetical protein [Candidatus Omnitrophota bacterium]MDD5488075.1 hypothetical protein [Candidatus Omnitrophota bacterium]